MKKVTYCLTSLALMTGCSAEDSKDSKTDNPYYKVEKIKTAEGAELEKVTISGPPTPPKGFNRPVVKSNTANKINTDATSDKDPLSKDKNKSFTK